MCVTMESAPHQIHNMWRIPYIRACPTLPGQVIFCFMIKSLSHLQTFASSQSKLSNSSGLMVKGNDVTDFTARGKMWFSVLSFLIQDCGSLDECQDLIHGATGKQVQICIDKCAFEFGEQKLETALCDLAGGSSTAGLAVFFLSYRVSEDHAAGEYKYIEDPIIHAVESIQDAATNFAQKMGSSFLVLASGNHRSLRQPLGGIFDYLTIAESAPKKRDTPFRCKKM